MLCPALLMAQDKDRQWLTGLGAGRSQWSCRDEFLLCGGGCESQAGGKDGQIKGRGRRGGGASIVKGSRGESEVLGVGLTA